jgi:hypothetical protein
MQYAVVNIATPVTPTYNKYTAGSSGYGVDLALNTVNNKVYAACTAGIVELGDVSWGHNTIITSPLGTPTGISLIPSLDDAFVRTNYSTGEILAMYEGLAPTIGMDIRFPAIVYNDISTRVNFLNYATVGSDVRFLQTNNAAVGMDIRFISEAFATLQTPIARTDFHVFIGGVELTDVKLDSITIRHTVDEKSEATFMLARQHDNVNYTMAGTLSTITGNPAVTIIIGGVTNPDGTWLMGGNQEFGFNTPAYVWDIDTQSEAESVKVICYSQLPQQDDRSTVTMSLPSVNEKLSMYHVLIHNPTIDNPTVLADDQNPPYYLGVQIDPGYQKTQNVTRYGSTSTIGQEMSQKINYVFGSGDSGVYDFNGDSIYFQPVPNWTYFWFGLATNFVTGAKWTGLAQGGSSYLGSSPSSLTSDTWDVTFIDWYYQRQFPDSIKRLGTCTVYPSDYIGVVPTDVEAALRNHVGTPYTGDYVWNAKLQLIIESNQGSPIAGTLAISNGNIINSQTGTTVPFGDFHIISSTTTKTLDLIDSKLGVFWGSAPYKKVSCKSGILTPASRWEDQYDALYLHTDAGYDYTDYVNLVGALEYKKMQNINGSVLPKTKADVEVFLDGYYHYNIALLKRINIDNTIQANAFNGNNGFPVSVKSIDINSKSMKVILGCNNQWSRLELLELEGQMPEPSNYETPERMQYITPKFDPNSLKNTN